MLTCVLTKGLSPFTSRGLGPSDGHTASQALLVNLIAV